MSKSSTLSTLHCPLFRFLCRRRDPFLTWAASLFCHRWSFCSIIFQVVDVDRKEGHRYGMLIGFSCPRVVVLSNVHSVSISQSTILSLWFELFVFKTTTYPSFPFHRLLLFSPVFNIHNHPMHKPHTLSTLIQRFPRTVQAILHPFRFNTFDGSLHIVEKPLVFVDRTQIGRVDNCSLFHRNLYLP